MAGYPVDKLQVLVDENGWRKAFILGINAAIDKAGEDMKSAGIIRDDLNSFYRFLSKYSHWVPEIVKFDGKKPDVTPFWMLSVFYFVFDQKPIIDLQTPIKPGEHGSTLLSEWIHDFAWSFGRFLDQPESAAHIDTFKKATGDESYNLEQYIPDPWHTFNEFFARRVKKEDRPIAKDPSVASPCDATFDNHWPIENGTITFKGIDWKISELLADSQFKDQFKDGDFMHAFLKPHDYHHVHAPVSGKLLEVLPIKGDVYLEVEADENGGLIPRRRFPDLNLGIEAMDNPGYQWNQVRCLWVFDTSNNKRLDIGLVALFAVGMAQISSVTPTVEEGNQVGKGDDIGYLKYGGSDYILLFQKGKVSFKAEPGKKYLVGEEIAIANKK